MHLLLSLFVLFATWISWTCFCLLRNYRLVRSIDLPIVISPTATLNPLWIIAYKLIPWTIPALKLLPTSIGKWVDHTYMGWQFDDKHAVHDKLGPAFVLCTPSINEVIIADPLTADTILHKRKDFVKPAIMYDGLNVFGKNVDSVEGETWQRHRKLTAQNFNEGVSSSVWSESIRQAAEMLREWTTMPEGSQEVAKDTATLALHVLTYAGLGIQYSFTESPQQVDKPHTMSYRNALLLILTNFTLLVMIPMNALTFRFFPAHIRRVGRACQEFKLYMREMVLSAKDSLASNKTPEATNLLSALVKANQAEQHGLSNDELYGNLFIYNMAGHETTANTLATAIAYLAADPQWQEWVFEELRATTPSLDPAKWEYKDIFPKLQRCLAVMYETLRLHGSTVFLPKSTGNTSQIVTIVGKEHTIPPNTFVVVNSQALHCDPAIWAPDALTFRPDRWIAKGGRPGSERLIEPQPGTFMGWAGGPRVCPGKKFSQVEFAAVMAVLFRGCRVAPKGREGESEKRTRERVKGMIDDSGITAITLQMRNPREVPLVWRKIV